MTQWYTDMIHAEWRWHDFYWLGACFFMLHFIWISPSTLKRKNVLGSLLVMTAFWPITYAVSIYHIMRLRLRRIRQ